MGIISNFGELLGMAASDLLPPVHTRAQIQKELYSAQWEIQTRKLNQGIKKDSTEIVGVVDPVFAETSKKTDNTVPLDDALTETIDFTSSPNTANIRLYNGRGFNVYLTRAQIHGKPITRSRGANGAIVNDALRREDDIRRNGENLKTVANDYIFDATQVDTLADYWYKRCGQKKHVYALQIKGSALWYEPGEWYTLALGGAGRNEYIDCVVEIVSVSVSRSAGGIGSTQLVVRECMESWAKTTLYTARLITGASPKRRTDQSNVIRVASSSFDGTYGSRCDGTADNVQIQAAIDYLYSIGGGEVALTAGTYTIASAISIKSGVWLHGCGDSTVLKPSAHDVARIITISASSNRGSYCSDFRISGTGIVTDYEGDNYIMYGNGAGNAANIIIEGYTYATIGGTITGIYGFNSVIGCSVRDNEVEDLSSGTAFYGIRSCNTVSNSEVRSNEALTTAYFYGFASCTNISSCLVISNTGSYITAYLSCTGMAACKAISNSCDYFVGYRLCTNLATCFSITNTGSSSEVGFSACKSVQQCKTDDTGTYGTGATQSYADTGNSYGCADTANGAYNR